jgi:NADPH-dependent curcumin reductase CurA
MNDQKTITLLQINDTQLVKRCLGVNAELTFSEVIGPSAKEFKPGDAIASNFGWRDYA